MAAESRPVPIVCPLCSAALGVVALNAQFFTERPKLAVSVECEANGIVHHSLSIQSPMLEKARDARPAAEPTDLPALADGS